MVLRNPHFESLNPTYLFVEVKKRVNAFLQKKPDAHLLSLSVGDTSEPIPESISKAMEEKAHALSTVAGYSGYGFEAGEGALREKISEVFYPGKMSASEIFISDGAKCDIGRLQVLFGSHVRVAVQDPAYPVYVDTSHIMGSKSLHLLPCLPENDFFPDLKALPPCDLIYFCSPNNPTGAAATKEQLKALLEAARQRKAILIFDSAYSGYIQDPSIPRSIYEIEGADEVAIEISSFSKFAGFTGVRLGWTVVPKALKYEDGRSVHSDWSRIVTTFFNGASNIPQAGGIAALMPRGREEMRHQIAYYLENARLIRQALERKSLQVYGGIHAPYLWIGFGKEDSWGLFDYFLDKLEIITTPGSGFGKSGEGYLRMTAFGHRETILQAVQRIETL